MTLDKLSLFQLFFILASFRLFVHAYFAWFYINSDIAWLRTCILHVRIHTVGINTHITLALKNMYKLVSPHKIFFGINQKVEQIKIHTKYRLQKYHWFEMNRNRD